MNKQKWMDKASEMGFEGLEITQSHSASREVSWFDHAMNSFTVSENTSVSIRGLIDSKVVAMAMENVDDDQMEQVLSDLKAQASFVSDTEKDILTSPQETETVESQHVWNRPSASKIKEVLASLEEKILAQDEDVIMVNYLSWADQKAGAKLINSNGVNAGDETEMQIIAAGATMKDGEGIKDDDLYEVVKDLDTFDQDAFAKKLVDAIRFRRGASPIEAGKYPVIIRRDAMSSLFGCFASMFSGSLISKGVSPIRDDLGKQIFSDKITVIDDARMKDALLLQNYDDEGTPTYAKDVVKDGIFETILHNTKSALKMNTVSTGNGFKKGAGATSASYSNLYIVPGDHSLEEMEQDMKDGIVITDFAGMHAGTDFITTNFSLQAQGYVVKDGKKDRPLTLITAAGNFLELMKKVREVGNDLDWKASSLACPSIYFEEMTIGG